MPTSATGRSRLPFGSPRAETRGFTLIEMLVVLVIIGVLAVTTSLSVAPNKRRDAKAEVDQLSMLLEAAAIETQAGGRQLAWSTEDDGYSFWQSNRREETRWLPMDTDERFHTRRLGEGLHIERVEVDGRVVPPAGLLIFGRSNPPLFRIVLTLAGPESRDAKSIELRGMPTGKVDVTEAP